MEQTVDDEPLKFDLPLSARPSLNAVLKNIADVAARWHDPDNHMGNVDISNCDGCYVLTELKQIRKTFNLAHERANSKTKDLRRELNNG